MSAIFVCYPRGAGGEFFASALSKHCNFYQGKYSVNSTGKLSFDDSIISFFHYHHVKKTLPNPVETFQILKPYIDDGINYTFPLHNTQKNKEILSYIKENSNSKVISIFTEEHQKLVNLEAIRKLFLSNEVFDNFLIKVIYDLYKLDSETVKKFYKKQLNYVDVILLSKQLPLDNTSRIQYVTKYINDKHNSPYEFSDFLLRWEDLFYNLNNITVTYNSIMEFLQIKPDQKILDFIIERNYNNKKMLDSYNYEKEIESFYASIFS